jgi:hypothetical protein
MKEIHAYLNDDGTYRVEAVCQCDNNGELVDATLKAARAIINIDVLTDMSSKEIYTLIIEEG